MTKNGGRAGAAAEGLQCLTCCPARQVRRPKAADVVLPLLAACQKKNAFSTAKPEGRTWWWPGLPKALLSDGTRKETKR